MSVKNRQVNRTLQKLAAAIGILFSLGSLCLFLRILAHEVDPPSRLQEGAQVPIFEAATSSGLRVSTGQFQGREYLVVFFSPDCIVCQGEIPLLKRLTGEMGVGTSIVGVSFGSAKRTREFLDGQNWDLPTALDSEKLLRGRFAVRRLPSSFLVDGEGRLVRLIEGQTNERVYRSLLERLRNER